MKILAKLMLLTASLLGSSVALAQPTALVIFAHPDDELMMNGSIRYLADLGVDVHVAYSTSGKYGRDVRGIIVDDPEELGRAREEESTNALAVLGVPAANIHYMRLDDQSTDEYKMAGPIKTLFDRVNPDIAFTFGPEGLYGHPDHRALSTAVSYVFNNVPNAKILLYAAISKTKDAGYDFSVGKGQVVDYHNVRHLVSDEAINFQFDVTPYIEYQKESLNQYLTQISDRGTQKISHFYENSACPGDTANRVCEQFVLARIKPRISGNLLNALKSISINH